MQGKYLINTREYCYQQGSCNKLKIQRNESKLKISFNKMFMQLILFDSFVTFCIG